MVWILGDWSYWDTPPKIKIEPLKCSQTEKGNTSTNHQFWVPSGPVGYSLVECCIRFWSYIISIKNPKRWFFQPSFFRGGLLIFGSLFPCDFVLVQKFCVSAERIITFLHTHTCNVQPLGLVDENKSHRENARKTRGMEGRWIINPIVHLVCLGIYWV